MEEEGSPWYECQAWWDCRCHCLQTRKRLRDQAALGEENKPVPSVDVSLSHVKGQCWILEPNLKKTKCFCLIVNYLHNSSRLFSVGNWENPKQAFFFCPWNTYILLKTFCSALWFLNKLWLFLSPVSLYYCCL